MRALFAGLCVLGIALPVAALGPLLIEHGSAPGALLRALLADPVSGSLGLDIVVSSLVLGIFVFAEERLRAAPARQAGPPEALLRDVDCVSLPVADLDAALEFWRTRLGHELIWRSPTAAGLRLPDCAAELVVHTEDRPAAAELGVEEVPAAVERFRGAGGAVLVPPFEIQIGRCAVVRDPWNNALVLLDRSKGLLVTDDSGNVLPDVRET